MNSSSLNTLNSCWSSSVCFFFLPYTSFCFTAASSYLRRACSALSVHLVFSEKKKVCNLIYSSFPLLVNQQDFRKGPWPCFHWSFCSFPNVGLACQVHVCWYSLGSRQNAHLKQRPIRVHWMGHNRLWEAGCHSCFFLIQQKLSLSKNPRYFYPKCSVILG